MEILKTYLPFLIPLVLLQVVAQVLALINLFKSDTRVRGGNKILWAVVLVLGELLGVLVYLLFGRLQEDAGGD